MINLDRLFKLRLVVARMGEMDNARWWNTNGQLGRMGAMALRRGFPRTYPFAQARAVFAVAAQRCAEVFDPPSSVTLWKLTADAEDAFEQRWHHWLEDAGLWGPFFEKLEAVFWEEAEGGKWKKRAVLKDNIDALVAERTSSAVKAALAVLWGQSGGSGQTLAGKGRAAAGRGRKG